MTPASQNSFNSNAKPTHADGGDEFRMDIDATGFNLTKAQAVQIEDEMEHLKPLIAKFPTRVLHVNLKFNANSDQYEVRLALVLPGQTFATGGVDTAWHPVLETAVHKLKRRVEHYKEDLENVTARRHHAADHDHPVEPTQQIDGHALLSAVEADQYSDFRQLLSPFESSLRDRIGRWVQRYPQINAMIGESIFIADILEEVFLLAFERFAKRTPQLMLGPWLETLVDPAVQQIASDPERELEAIGFLRSWQETETVD